MAPKKQKQGKQPFWKTLNPELRHIGDHIGKIVDNSNIRDLADVVIMGSLAYLGYNHFKEPIGALIGPVGYRLATTEGGTPPVSQIAGLTILGAMGIASYAPSWQQAFEEAVEERLRVEKFPIEERPYSDQWVMAQITGSTRLEYCAWVKDFYGITPPACIKG